MILAVYQLLWIGGLLLSIGAYSGRARGYTAIMGVFTWLVIGISSSAVIVLDGGSEFTYTITSVAWLAYGNAGMHAVVTVLHVHDVLTSMSEDAEDTADIDQAFPDSELKEIAKP